MRFSSLKADMIMVTGMSSPLLTNSAIFPYSASLKYRNTSGNDAINKTYRGESIENYTKLFDVSPLNISKEIGMGVPISNNKLYDDYIASYIKKPGTKEEFFWQQVANHISESY